ncbi:hypothetical protein Ocin01_01271 [Orchesella cincta]|uniref:Cilia- and flagella-associated protein 300 n=1 Tax=Orchesella cincta TaxID=48709 RepID=A0A1D2NJI6_ORCCI|nr:hypothetical protein Ocin01_01271 [Orchesella cincta]
MDPGGHFNFQYLPNQKFQALENQTVKENLGKWSMIDGLKFQAYSFDKTFRKYNERDFLTEFMGCQNVVSTLLKATPDHGFSPIGVPVDVVKFSEVKCSLTTVELFEKLKDNKIARRNGSIVKCMPHYIRADVNNETTSLGFELEIADNLRKLLLCNEDDIDDFEDISQTLSEDDRKEFLCNLFSHLVIGGSLCQYEDNVEPYIQTTKLLYKDLIAVASNPQNVDDRVTTVGQDRGDGEGLKIISHVYKIHSAVNEFAGNKDTLFNRQYLNNFFYVIVNPLKQICFTVYHHV